MEIFLKNPLFNIGLGILFLIVAFGLFVKGLKSIKNKWDFFRMLYNENGSFWGSIIMVFLSVCFLVNGVRFL